MLEICWGKEEIFLQMAQEQDEIGWRCFMEGMICNKMHEIQHLYRLRSCSKITATRKGTGYGSEVNGGHSRAMAIQECANS